MTGRFEADYGNGWEPVSINRVRKVASANQSNPESFIDHVVSMGGQPVRLSPFSYVRYVKKDADND